MGLLSFMVFINNQQCTSKNDYRMYQIVYFKRRRIHTYIHQMADLPIEVKRSLAQEFFDFLKTFGISGLAIAFVIGQAASKLVTALVVIL